QTSGTDAMLTFNEIREDEHTVNRVSRFLQSQNDLKTQKLEAVINYVHDNSTCKSKLILEYFGDKRSENCGICSNCLLANKTSNNLEDITNEIYRLLAVKDVSSREIELQSRFPKKEILNALQHLLELDKIAITSSNKYTINNG